MKSAISSFSTRSTSAIPARQSNGNTATACLSFLRHGGKVVFFGRFVAVLRMCAAFLAGTNRMPWLPFLVYNTVGGVVWAAVFGLGGYLLGDNVHRLMGPVGWVVLAVIAALRYVQRHEARLAEQAERALP